jgi:hypothetical protein
LFEIPEIKNGLTVPEQIVVPPGLTKPPAGVLPMKTEYFELSAQLPE